MIIFVLRDSEIKVLRAVSGEAISQREIASITGLANRTIRYVPNRLRFVIMLQKAKLFRHALTKLSELELVKEVRDFTDLRKKRYEVSLPD